MRKLVWTDKNEPWPIVLTQTGRNLFTVQYGLQRDAGLAYGEAASKLGQAIMHKAACDGPLESMSKKRDRENALTFAQDAQRAYWDAKSELEELIGHNLDDVDDLSTLQAEDL